MLSSSSRTSGGLASSPSHEMGSKSFLLLLALACLVAASTATTTVGFARPERRRLKGGKSAFPLKLSVVLNATQTHYGNPSKGCLSDEIAVRIEGVSGDMCAPSCAEVGCWSGLCFVTPLEHSDRLLDSTR